MTVPRYRKAPILEATIDIGTRSAPNTSTDDVKNVFGTDRENFPEMAELRKATVEFQLGRDDASATQQVVGWALRSADRARAVQSRLDGFSFALAAPYSNWEAFQEEARRLWLKYRDSIGPEAVTQITLRYANRFDLPVPVVEMKDFFRTSPDISPSLPQQMAGLFMQVQVPYPDVESMLVLTQTIVPPPQTGYVSVVVDILLARAVNVPQEDNAIWKLLWQLRDIKNGVFEACITDATRELIR